MAKRFYKDTAANRKLGRVGKEIIPKGAAAASKPVAKKRDDDPIYDKVGRADRSRVKSTKYVDSEDDDSNEPAPKKKKAAPKKKTAPKKTKPKESKPVPPSYKEITKKEKKKLEYKKKGDKVVEDGEEYGFGAKNKKSAPGPPVAKRPKRKEGETKRDFLLRVAKATPKPPKALPSTAKTPAKPQKKKETDKEYNDKYFKQLQNKRELNKAIKKAPEKKKVIQERKQYIKQYNDKKPPPKPPRGVKKKAKELKPDSPKTARKFALNILGDDDKPKKTKPKPKATKGSQNSS